MEIFNCLNEAFYIDSDGPFYAVSNNTNGCVALAFETRKYGDEYIENNINFFKKVFEQSQENFSKRIEKYGKENSHKTVNEIINFVQSQTTRSYCQPKNFSQ